MPKSTTGSKASTDFFADLKARAGNVQRLAKGQETEEDPSSEKIELLPIDSIAPNPDQPRQISSPDEDKELSEDIKARGVLQPVLVRVLPGKSGQYQLIAGERRTRAAKAAGLNAIPAIVKNYDDREARTVAAIENLQRKDLDPLDEARYFQFLSQEYNLSNRDLARLLHKSPSYVDQRVRLLKTEEVNRVKSTQKLQTSQNEPVESVSESEEVLKRWKYRPKEWEKLRLTITQARSSYQQVKPEEREILRETIRDLKKELEELEAKLDEVS